MPLDSAAGAPDRMVKENLIFPVLSTPWKIYLLITIGTGTVRFGVLRRSLPSISRVSVTKYLTELERDGFLFRMEYPAPPLHTEYRLTPLGLRVLPILRELLSLGGAIE